MEENSRELLGIDSPIRRYVTKKVIGIEKNKSIQESVARMVEFDISSITVTDNGKVVGFLTDSDIKKRVVAGGISPAGPIETVMTRELISADINTSVRDVMALMSDHAIKHMLITEKDEVVGLITLRDIEDLSMQRFETYIARE